MSVMQISLSESLFDQLQRIATRQGATLHEFLEQVVKVYGVLPSEQVSSIETILTENSGQAQRTQIEREQQRYEAQHEQLFAQYAGEYVAMQNGQVIDHDMNRAALGQRIRTEFGNLPIFITPVLPEPLQVIHIRSPRLINNESATA